MGLLTLRTVQGGDLPAACLEDLWAGRIPPTWSSFPFRAPRGTGRMGVAGEPRVGDLGRCSQDRCDSFSLTLAVNTPDSGFRLFTSCWARSPKADLQMNESLPWLQTGMSWAARHAVPPSDTTQTHFPSPLTLGGQRLAVLPNALQLNNS